MSGFTAVVPYGEKPVTVSTTNTTTRMEPSTAVLLSFISKLGLQKYYPNKLSLQSLLEINKNSIYEEAVTSVEEIPLWFLRKLLTINAECRNSTHFLNTHADNDDIFGLDSKVERADNIHPLDLIVALFLCADRLLQQEMALKMSMCQFSVPLLLPHSGNSQCSLMMWALRDIVKEWCPHTLSESRGFVEDSIVESRIPFFSFVRLRHCSLSKSDFLNRVLSRGQQNHNMFVHREMEGGALERKIANGMTEVCWYLPCGRENLDIFPEPVAFANLRGDISKALTQFTFLYEVSTTTFVFLDKVEEDEHRILSSLQDAKSKLVFVVNRKEENARENMMSVKATMEELGLPKTSVRIKDPRINVAEFSKMLSKAIKTCLSDVRSTMSIADMLNKAVELGLSVDESPTHDEKDAAKEIMRGIGVRSIPRYKELQLPLQGENWKKLSQLDKKLCHINNDGEAGVEHYKCELQKEKQKIWEKQRKQKLSKGMMNFIQILSKNERDGRDIFLKWMKFILNTHSRTKLKKLRNDFKDQCRRKNAKLIAELDQALMDSSLGVEHYMREMGLIYEVSLQSKNTAAEMFDLPGLAAQMLLDGHPLELLDGDASNIPERWLTDVLTQLHDKVGGRSRLVVLTVLGVQSSGKSTLLNTMFGVQFPVSSGRCTRGAYMLFLKVGEDMQSMLGCDFVVLIDTEGLKSPDLAQLEDSYEHDNQLATIVIGLSDVTIINIAMENSTEMKDVLQIAVHAFLRMKQIGKKPVCHFVHQNVGGVSAHTKSMTERKHLLDHLNEMTQIAAEMERQPSIKAFTDVLDYDIEKNNWNIPGLWHGTPPMSPVNTGYSEAVADFKRSLLESVRKESRDEVSKIPQFLEWLRSLWKAVKYENFIFSFRNTLVAHAYDNLCKEFSQWEWELRKEVLSRQQAAEVEILNADNEAQLDTWNSLVASKKTEVFDEINAQETTMKSKLRDYYKRKDKRVNLIEKYKTDFVNNIINLSKEVKRSMSTKLDLAFELKIASKRTRDIQRKHRGEIEECVMKLLSDCKGTTLSDDDLTKEFKKMWSRATVNVPVLKERDIPMCILKQLRKNLRNRNVNENLEKIVDLTLIGKDPFEIRREHNLSVVKWFQCKLGGVLHIFTNSIIETCRQFVLDQSRTNKDYHDSFTRDLLEIVDDSLERNRNFHKMTSQFEIDLKLHICGIASREFRKMHRKFLSDNDPRTQLDNFKTQYLSDFLDLYKQKDHCQRKANDFVQICIKPAVDEYINRSLGIAIVDEILTSSHSAEYSSRSFFQYNIQKEILLQENFESLVKYISSYEIYVKDWIFVHTQQKMSEDKTLCKLKNQNLHVIMKKIEEAIEKASRGEDGHQLPDDNRSIKEFIKNMHTCLIKDISISADDEKVTLFQIQSTCHPFIRDLKTSMEKLMEQLKEEFLDSENIAETLYKLSVRPQDELFKRVFGCGHQCPFCKVPCEAGGKDHQKHHAAVHRPQGLGAYRNVSTQILIESLCTTDVNSQREFKNTDTKWEFHPYKEYTTYYPDWHISPDSTIEASDYWKYVLVKYNDSFAQEYKAKPANVPEAWRTISKVEALKALKVAYNIK